MYTRFDVIVANYVTQECHQHPEKCESYDKKYQITRIRLTLLVILVLRQTGEVYLGHLYVRGKQALL